MGSAVVRRTHPLEVVGQGAKHARRCSSLCRKLRLQLGRVWRAFDDSIELGERKERRQLGEIRQERAGQSQRRERGRDAVIGRQRVRVSQPAANHFSCNMGLRFGLLV